MSKACACGTCACYDAIEGQCRANPPRQYLVPASPTQEEMKAAALAGLLPEVKYNIIAAWPPVQVDQWCMQYRQDPIKLQ